MGKENGTLTIREMAESERPRERLMRYGAGSLSNAELLAILIQSGTKKESALDLASRLLSGAEGKLYRFSSYLPKEYCGVKGIGEAAACKIAAAVEFGRRVSSAPRDRILLNTPDALADYVKEMSCFRKEVLRIAMYNAKTELIRIADVSAGGLSASSFSARELFSEAIREGAAGIILIHNHPSGDPSPSRADIEATRRAVEAGRLIGIKVCDHLIIGENAYFSFREQSLLDDEGNVRNM